MIVLQIDVRGHSADVRWAGAEAVLGSGPAASIRREDAGWSARAAVLVHLGDRVLVVRGDGSGEARLAVGESVVLGSATVTLVGIAPLSLREATDDEASPVVALPRADAPETGWRPTLEDDVPAAKPTLAAAATAAPSPAAAAPPSPPAPPASPAAAGPAPTADAPVGRTRLPRPNPWRVGSFEDELNATLRRTPWFALSAAIHAVLVAVLMILVAEPPPPVPDAPLYGILAAGEETPKDAADSGGPTERPDPLMDPEIAKAPELDAEETVPDTRPDVPAPKDATPPSPKTPERLEMPEPEAEAPPPVIGPAPALWALKSGKSKPAAPKPASSDEVVNLDPDRALDVNKKAAARLRGDLSRPGGALGRALKGLKREDIVVVRGSFDHMEAVLEEIGVPYVLVTPFEAADDYDWPRHKVVFWNCGELVVPPRLRPRLHAAIRDFVRNGGYLFTTDWAIATVLEPAFPGYVRSEGGVRPLPELLLDVRPARGAANHALLDGVFGETTTGLTWWLENSSFDVQVLDPSKVDTLIEAPSLAAAPLRRSSAVAVTFAVGRGRVLHVMGHYFQQKGTVSGAAGSQRIALNFVRMRLEREGIAAVK